MARAPEKPDPRVAQRALVLSTIAVVATFSGSLWYSQFRLASIDNDVIAIQTNAAPAIEHLVNARGEILQLGVATTEFLLGPASSREDARERITLARASLEKHLAAYDAIPFFPDEAREASSIPLDAAALDTAIRDHILDTQTSSLSDDERVAAFRATTAARDRLSQTIEALIELNTAQIQRRLDEILAARESAMHTALVLGIASVFFAVIATVFALITVHHQNRLVAERRAFLERKTSELEAFAGRVAHDLRNPLAALMLLVSAQQRKRGDDVALEKIADHLRGMNRIIDAFLDFARSGASPAPGTHAELREVVSEVVEEVQPLADQANTTLAVDEFAAVEVACAPGALKSVLGNLVQNAVKHMSSSERADAERKIAVHVEGREAWVRVDIADTGPGIPEEKLPSIFDPFVRAGSSHVQGIGLGLATVKRIVESHGGRVGVRSSIGTGSDFWFELPRFSKETP